MEPKEGNGLVRFTLSESTADVMARVSSMKKWHVMPTMVRGAAKTSKPANGQAPDFGGEVTGKKAPRPKKNKVKSCLVDISAETITRSEEGAEAIKVLMEELHRLDMARFPDSPIFENGGMGACKLKFPGASGVTWAEVLERSPAAFSSVHLGYPGCVLGVEAMKAIF